MRLFKHRDDNSYYTQERNTLRWHLGSQWEHEMVPKPEGQLLAEGIPEKVMKKVKQILPSELYEEISAFYQIGEKRLVLP